MKKIIAIVAILAVTLYGGMIAGRELRIKAENTK